MIIEVLFGEAANLFGDLFNIRYLEKSIPDAKVCYTSFQDEPRFLSEKVDLIYMGPMPEKDQAYAIEKLMPHRERIAQLIEEGAAFLVTGNALEIFGQYIETDEGEKIPCLGIFQTFARRKMMDRHNSIFLGRFLATEGEELKIMGYKSQFTHSFYLPDQTEEGLFEVIRGIGLNPEARAEGLCRKHFFGTYLLGPLLIMNPPFARFLVQKVLKISFCPPFEKESQEAYEDRLIVFEDQKTTGFSA